MRVSVENASFGIETDGYVKLRLIRGLFSSRSQKFELAGIK